jgi:hypothetical protein
MKSHLQINLFAKNNLVIVIFKKYTLITLSTFLDMRENFQEELIIFPPATNISKSALVRFIE